VAANDQASLALAIDRLTGVDGERPTAVPALRLYRFSAPTDHVAIVFEASLCVVVQGSKELIVADETYRYDPGHSLLVSVDLPAIARVVEASPSRPCLVARVSIDPAVVRELSASATTDKLLIAPSRGLAVSPVEPPLLDAVTRLVALLDTPRDIAPLAPLILREITYRVLSGPEGARLRQIVSAGAPAQQVARAIHWLRNHFADPLRIATLARMARMSPSAFFRHFKSVTAMSPLQYQKRLRLEEARRLMLGERLDAGEAAFRVGYESPSQFSREYRRVYGAPPRQDVASLSPASQPGRYK
jgi:AraC-like DNA-binding protein